MTTQLKRNALGQRVRLGDVYDARIDKVLGLSLFKGPQTTWATAEFSTCTDTTFAVGDDYSTKFSILQVPSDQQVSVLVGFLDSSLNESGLYLKHPLADDRSVRNVAKISVTTKTETLRDPAIKENLNTMLKFDKRLQSATHVVSKVEWGANLVLVFQYKNEENADKSVAASMLHSYVQHVTMNPISTEFSKQLKDISITAFCDCDDDMLQEKLNSLTEFLDAAHLSMELLSLVQNQPGQLGKPIGYTLEPISKFSELLLSLLNILLDKERELKYQHRFQCTSPTFNLTICGEAEIFILKADIPLAKKKNDPLQELPFVDKRILKYVFVDCDSLPEGEDEGIVSDTTIHFYNNGKAVSTNLYETSASYSGKKSAKSIKPLIRTYDGIMPNKIAHVKIKCPGSFVGRCQEHSEETWICWKCEQRLEYRFDSHFYCPCGKGDITDFRFQCCGEFIEFTNKAHLYSQLKTLKQFTEKTILLLGSTGVGKSTWINSVANYLTYKTMDEAARNEIVALIPSKFTLTDSDFEQVEIAVGEDANEVLVSGQSATQQPTSYTFKTTDEFVRIIDTPGIGDTRGVEQDKFNFEYIMKHLSHIDQLHGICILVKPNLARLEISLEFCLKELLTHLPRDAAHNIVFCFTNSRSTFYRPGDTMAPLKALLEGESLMESLLTLSKDTVYCMDNEAFRFLAAVKCGESFGDDEKKNFSASWSKSVTETRRLLAYLNQVAPHETKSTVVLNSTRQLILSLSQPIAEIDMEIQSENAVIADRKSDQAILNQKCADLNAGKTTMTQLDVERTNISARNTVCASAKCKETIMVGIGNVKTHYKQICHRNCTCAPGSTVNQLQCAQLQKCSCMTVVNRKYQCSYCHCLFDCHMHLDYETSKKTIQVTSSNVATDMEDAQKQNLKIAEMIKEGEDKIKAYQAEREEITKTTSKFALYLQKHAISPYNDALLRYLDHQITIEEDRICVDGKNETLARLNQLKQTYTAEIDILRNAVENPLNEDDVVTDEIVNDVENLYSLPQFGKKIKSLIEHSNKSKRYIYAKKSFIPNPALQSF